MAVAISDSVFEDHGFTKFKHTNSGREVWARNIGENHHLIEVGEKANKYDWTRVNAEWFRRFHKPVAK